MTTHPQPSANAAGTPGRRYAPWWRRALGYLLRTVLPWSFLAQALGSIIAHDAWATGRTGDLIRLGAFAIVITLTALLARNGRPWSSRLLHMTVRRMDGEPASKATLLVRELAHLLDFVSLGVGFLWPLFSSHRQTFADMITGTVVLADT